MTQDIQHARQNEEQKGRKPNRVIQRVKTILLPLVLLGLAVIIVESLVAFHLLPLPALVGNILILPALLIAFFFHLGSFGALSDKEWSHTNVVGCIPGVFGLFSILGYFSYIAGISMIAMPAWNQWNLGASFMYLSGILSAPLIVLYLQRPQALEERG